MKRVLLVFMIYSFLYLISCKQSPSFQNIQIGMTYDEVEKIVDKPISIKRGVNQIGFTINDTTLYGWDILKDKDLANNKTDTSKWIIPGNKETVGVLIYVTWDYSQIRTNYYYIEDSVYKTFTDTNYKESFAYYLGKYKVSKSEYDNYNGDGYIYLSYDHSPIDKGLYDSFVRSKMFSMPRPEKAVKRVVKNISKGYLYITKFDHVKRTYYEVKKRLCVIFDAASGRVIETRFCPYEINKL